MFLFLSFYRQTFNLRKMYIQKSTQIVSAQLGEVLQSKLTGVTRTQMKKQNIANRLGPLLRSPRVTHTPIILLLS